MQWNCCRETELWWATLIKMNTGKTQIMICGGRHTLSCIPTPQIDIDGERLLCEPVIKDLGVYLDQHMTFSRYVGHLVRQMSGTLCYISRCRYFVTEHAICLLADSLVLSKLSYSSVVWGGISQTDVNRLQEVGDFAARVLFNEKKKEPVSSLLRQLNWLSVGNRLLLDFTSMLHAQS